MMKWADVKNFVQRFYRSSDKPTFWFALVILNQLMGFTPNVPSFVIYAAMISYALYCLMKPIKRVNINLIVFSVYVPIGLIITTPDSVFHSWERFILFILLLLCVSPLLVSSKLMANRQKLFKIALFVSTVIGVGSFFARFLGINFMSSNNVVMTQAGTFGGLTVHSMLLGPIAGVGTLFMSYCAYTNKKKIYWLLAFFCLLAVAFSASRSSLMATLVGLVVMLYKLSGTASKFVSTAVVVILIGALTFPLWEGALEGVRAKNEGNINAGSAMSSRDYLWEARWKEFKSSPFFGLGFSAVDRDLANDASFDAETGMVESGSSWLIILSMTGIFGFLLIVPVFIKALYTTYTHTNQYAYLICGILVLFYLHMFAEGYIYYGGSLLAFIMWLTVGVANDSKYLKAVQ